MKADKHPLVTVFTLVYNTEKYVIETLESIKNQTYKNIEHIIIDDCSIDDSAKIVHEWIKKNNHNCTLIKNEENKGVIFNLNRILNLAKGKYLCGISDDLWSNEHLELQIVYFEKLPEDVAVLFSDFSTVDEQSQILKDTHRERFNDINNHNSQAQFIELLKGNFICAPTAIMRVSALRSVGGYDESRTAEDISMWLKLTANNYKLHFVEYNTTYYRIRRDGVTRQSSGKGSEEPLIYYYKYLGISKEIDKVLAPRFYNWTKRLVVLNKDYRLYWPLKTFYLNRNINSLLLLIYCVIRKLAKRNG